jgi:hypothetical protein
MRQGFGRTRARKGRTPSRTLSSMLDGAMRSLLVTVRRPIGLPDELDTGSPKDLLAQSIDRSEEVNRPLTACDTCFSISAAGTRVTEPASWLRPLSTAREM